MTLTPADTMAITLEDFVAISSKITVQLNWRELLTNRLPIRAVEIADRGTLGGLYTSWPRTESKFVVGIETRGARPMTVKDVDENFNSMPPKQKSGIQCYMDHFKTHPAAGDFPAYELRGNGYLLLDGNHRANAIYRAGVESFRVTLLAIHGPIDPRILPDLKYWCAKTAPAAATAPG